MLQESDFKEWKLVVQEIVRFLKADTAFTNIRPLRYSLVLDPHPDTLPQTSAAITKRSLKLQDAVLSSFHHNEVGIQDQDTFLVFPFYCRTIFVGNDELNKVVLLLLVNYSVK